MTSDQIKAMKRYDLSSYMEENCDGDGFNVECMDESDTGEYVKYADVLSLLARIEALEDVCYAAEIAAREAKAIIIELCEFNGMPLPLSTLQKLESVIAQQDKGKEIKP